MAKKNPLDEADSAVQFSAEEVAELKKIKKLPARIAVRMDFKEKMDLIAKHLDVPPGAVIEMRLRRFVRMAYPLAIEKEQAELAAKLQRQRAQDQ
jgi:hypothetical protein